MAKSEDSLERREALLSDYRDDESYDGKPCSHRPAPSARNTIFNWLVLGLLTTSVLINFALLGLSLRPVTVTSYEEPPSKYAHIARTHKEPYVYVTEYAAANNDTLQDEAWMSINDDLALVALPDDFVDAHELRRAQRFPWDHTKGLYVLHGIHNLHCLKLIYRSLAEHRRGDEQTRSWHHVSHCLDTLRRQIICDADDTPRATERRPEILAGLGQYRMCRSWDALEAFAKSHTACYKRPLIPEADGLKKLDRFKHCPPGSGYVPKDDYVPV
ncbi:hypothetical protein Golomagni_08371, partial [Golovinomyces magnicellulatus]